MSRKPLFGRLLGVATPCTLKTGMATLDGSAYAVLFMHCAKYPHRTVNGLLLGTANNDSVSVRETLPLFHSSLALAPMLEAALLLADEYCSTRDLKIVGYYQANEVVDDIELGSFGKKIADKIRSQAPQAAVLLLDGAKMRPTPADLRLVALSADGKRGTAPTLADAEASLAKLDAALAKGLQHELVDFDVHLDSPASDWLGNAAALYK